tara:strand:+ start:2332 stop:2610 length:279 start_codon:yes stop_codon:yes gene_type:complete
MAEEKTVELKPKAEKISEEHLKQLQQIVNNINGIQFNIGKIESQKHTLLHDLVKNQDRITLMQDVLMKEYGNYDVNLTDGTINWPKEKEDEK